MKKNLKKEVGKAVGKSGNAAKGAKKGCRKKELRRLRALSLFANVGIAETYLHEVGVDVVVANELLPERAKFYQHVYPDCKMIVGDVKDDTIKRQIVSLSKANNVEFIIATPPCQGMSSNNKLYIIGFRQ